MPVASFVRSPSKVCRRAFILYEAHKRVSVCGVYVARACVCACVCVCAFTRRRVRFTCPPRFPHGGRTRARDVTLARPRRVLAFYRRIVPNRNSYRARHIDFLCSAIISRYARLVSRNPRVGAVARAQRVRVFCTNLCIRDDKRASATSK